MSLLKNLIRNSISQGISKGVSNAVGKAVEKFVNPAAEKLAGQTAEKINETSAALETASENVKTAAEENKDGFAALESALGSWAQNAQKAAEELEKKYGEEAEKSNVLERWEQLLPGFPKWCFGGTDHSLEENGTNEQGEPYYIFTVQNTSIVALQAYSALLKQNGFKQKYPGTDEVLYKEENGAYLVFGQTEAMYDETTMSVNLCCSHDKRDLG